MYQALSILAVMVLAVFFGVSSWADAATSAADDTVQAQIILTVAESKRLIAKAIVQRPEVQQALREGTIIVSRGTTTTYVAEELTGQKIAHGAYVIGWTGPAKGGKPMSTQDRVDDIVLVKGTVQPGLKLDDALKTIKAGDVIIKGGNALDRDHKMAGILIGGGAESTAGTTGKCYPIAVARKAHFIVPIGLEKQVDGNIEEIAAKMREPIESLNDIPSMFLVNGTIVTEIEALQLLTGVSVFEAASGGVGGAEGSVRLICRGPREKVQQALDLAASIQGEPAFLE